MASGAIFVGTAVVSAIGGAGAVAALGSTLVGMIGGALIGAAVGGLTAAITGGDIGDGILFGAIGGAISGGISGYLAEGASALASTGDVVVQTQTGAATVTTTSQGAGLAAAEAGISGGNAGGGLVAGAASTAAQSGGFFSSLGGATKEALFTGVKDFAIAGYQGGKEADAREAEMKLQQDKMEREEAVAMANLATQERIAQMKIDASNHGGEGGGGSDGSNVARINAASALAVAKERSASVRDQIADAKASREEGYLKEDEKRQRMRDSAKGMLVKKRRTSAEAGAADQPEEFAVNQAPDTPTYTDQNPAPPAEEVV